MIILDTNVVSALMQATPDPRVRSWLDRQNAPDIWITAITVFEIRFGLAILPAGRRRKHLEAAFDKALAADLDHRVLAFDAEAASAAAAIASAARRAGRSVDVRDVEIAGIAAARNATLATHNLRHFRHLGLPLVDPITDPTP